MVPTSTTTAHTSPADAVRRVLVSMARIFKPCDAVKPSATTPGAFSYARLKDVPDWARKYALKLAAHRAMLVSSQPLRARCRHCGHEWQFDLQTHGTPPEFFWRCPNGCNAVKRTPTNPIR